jgi:hypothetical protein
LRRAMPAMDQNGAASASAGHHGSGTADGGITEE